jgi:hypothetical protein
MDTNVGCEGLMADLVVERRRCEEMRFSEDTQEAECQEYECAESELEILMERYERQSR